MFQDINLWAVVCSPKPIKAPKVWGTGLFECCVYKQQLTNPTRYAFNKGNLSHELSKYIQLIKCLSRGPLHCTGTLWPLHGPPDSCLQAEIKALQTCCEDIKAVLQWSHGWSLGVLGLYWMKCFQDCYQQHGWVHQGCDTGFYKDCCVPSRTTVCFKNDKSWFTAKLRQLRLEKVEAFRSREKDRLKEAKYHFRKEVREAKRLRNSNTSSQEMTLVLSGRGSDRPYKLQT